MKVSIDFDGTLWSHMNFFREFMKAMQAQGHQVGMLTGHKQESEEHDIAKMEEYNFPRPDFFFGRTPEYMHLNGAHYKSDMIVKHNIDIHFDDFDYDHPDTKKIFDSRQDVRKKIFKVEWKPPRSSKQE